MLGVTWLALFCLALLGHRCAQSGLYDPISTVLSLLSHISTHEHSQRSPKASSGCSRWPYRPSAQLGQAHRMNGGPVRRCCGVASVTPRCRIDSASQFDPADAWSDDHRQQSPTRAHRRRAGALRRIELELDARGCRQSACEPPPSRRCELLSELTWPVRASNGRQRPPWTHSNE